MCSKRPLDTPQRMIERKKGRRRDIEREGEREKESRILVESPKQRNKA